MAIGDAGCSGGTLYTPSGPLFPTPFPREEGGRPGVRIRRAATAGDTMGADVQTYGHRGLTEDGELMATEQQDGAVRNSPATWVAAQAELYESSGGTKGTTQLGVPCLLLDYVGRRSGIRRRTVLMYGRDGDDYLIVGSNGGSDSHPLWYLNLLDGPEVDVRVGTERFPALAETLPPEEKERVWPHLVEVFPRYAAYRAKTGRDIPVVRLRRR
ncbi:deazaflavin-dependent oxidoreductase (nitroreductase family) [Streptomyces griseus]